MTPCSVAQSYPSASRTSANSAGDATFSVLASVTVPGGLMNLNSKIVIIADWDFPVSSSTKTLAVDFGGSNISAPAVTTPNRAGKFLLEIQNINSLSIQKTFNAIEYGITPNTRASSSINTGSDVIIDFKCKWGAAVASETITLLGYSIWHYPGA